jgi:hypothetical protein
MWLLYMFGVTFMLFPAIITGTAVAIILAWKYRQPIPAVIVLLASFYADDKWAEWMFSVHFLSNSANVTAEVLVCISAVALGAIIGVVIAPVVPPAIRLLAKFFRLLVNIWNDLSSLFNRQWGS